MKNPETKREEKSLAKWHVEKIKENRQYFDYADLSQKILEDQKDEDLLLLGDWLTDLHNKLKAEDSRRKELLLLIQSIWRLEKYCGGLETVCKASTVRVYNLMKRIEELESESRVYKLKYKQEESRHEFEKKKLKEEIEFITKNG